MICENCGKEFFKDWRKDKQIRKTPCRFCCKSCSNTRQHSDETKQKIKNSIEKFQIKTGIKELALLKKKERQERITKNSEKVKCCFCGKEITRRELSHHEKSCHLNPNRIITHHARKRYECKEGYIYVITNILNNKKYVGKHVGKPEDSPNYFGSGIAINNAIEKYGKENFTKEILEYHQNANLDEREKFWIEKFNTLNEGYNLTTGGDGGDTQTGKHWFNNGKINVIRKEAPEGFILGRI